MDDDEEPSPWGGVVMVVGGVILLLSPVAALFLGLPSNDPVVPIGGEPLFDPVAALFAAIVVGFLSLLAGVGELQKAPPQYRLRTLFIVTAMVAAVLSLIYAARNY